MRAAEKTKREHARQPVVEVTTQYLGGRAASQQVGGSPNEQVAVEGAAQFPARVRLPAQHLRGARERRVCCSLVAHGRHYCSRSRVSAIAARSGGSDGADRTARY